jgi:hypothetical protein
LSGAGYQAILGVVLQLILPRSLGLEAFRFLGAGASILYLPPYSPGPELDQADRQAQGALAHGRGTHQGRVSVTLGRSLEPCRSAECANYLSHSAMVPPNIKVI